MKHCQPEYYTDFKCIASDCTDTCCRYWQVELDKEAFTFYREYQKNRNAEHPSRFIDGFLGNRYFKSKQNGDCVFLNEKQLCDLYCRVGHDNLPATCRLYPRFINNFGGYEERGLSFSCPAAAQLITENEFRLTEYHDDRPIENYVDIDAELFVALKNYRSKLIGLIDEFGEVNELFSFVVTVGVKLQKFVDLNQYSAIASLTKEDIIKHLCSMDFTSLRLQAIKEHMTHKHLLGDWVNMLKASRDATLSCDVEKIKTWIKYFVFRYFLKAAKDRRVDEKLYSSVHSALVIFSLKTDSVTAMQKYSKETEHNEYNMKRLFKDARRTFNKNCVDK